MKKYRKLILILLSVLLFVIVVCGVRSYYFNKGESVVFEIRDGQTGSSVAADLKKAGIIKSEILFKIVLRLFADPRGLKAGTYDLYKNTCPEEVISCISSGKCQHLEKVTIIEGWRIEEIAMALEDNGICDNLEFTALAKKQNLEGYLYPSTYRFSKNTPAQKVIDVMTGEFNRRVRPILQEQYMRGLSERAIITVASIVEREAVVHEERPKIAAVYLNRIKIGKKLEADPTVQYVLGYTPNENRFWKKGLTLRDLRIDSPYNTYRYGGIPPGPICSPSYESVYAVLHPEPNFDALFFVAEREDGKHVFSKTYNEHVANIRRIRKVR
ncbi:UPF0755 protein [Elusimicrobium simillimum]|uniref:endolytic transglycosylase MltG n=1 Tax=Elusimicrobium simillimum TaxID=3143438 RepID=UPI003C7061D1